jgi:ABC-2 type transport system ATP-binding protein
MIRAGRLSKRFGSSMAVDDLSFEVGPGRVTGFLGPNGAGKSTTMRMILGLDRPTSGVATVAGRPYHDHHRPLHHVGAVLESRAVDGGRTAYHHLLVLAQSNGITRRRVHEVIDLVGLSEVAGRRVRGFSLGMSQRLGLAAALLGDPPIILCDEPVNGLDPEGIQWIRGLLRGFAAEGRTVFVSSHLMSEMALTADHVIVIGRGRLLADTSIANVLGDSAQAYVRVRTAEPGRLSVVLHRAGASIHRGEDHDLAVVGLPITRIGELAATHGVTLHELSPQQPTLESAFLQLTQDATQFRSPVGAS